LADAGVTEEGENLHVLCGGEFEQESATAALNAPNLGSTARLKFADCPAFTVAAAESADTLKSVTVTWTVEGLDMVTPLLLTCSASVLVPRGHWRVAF
jgi:hypothetical protein